MADAALVRLATETDRAALGELAGLLEVEGATVVLMQHNDATITAAAIDHRGTARAPGEPVLRLLQRSRAKDEAKHEAKHEAVLLQRLIDSLPPPRPHRLLATCDPLDAAALARLEQLGFRPTGAMPYFEIGGSMVEYVSGYRDAVGSILELALPL